MSKSYKINLNSKIKVKLEPRGADIYYHQYDEFNERMKKNGGNPIEPSMPRIDSDGYTEMQLHVFMKVFGKHFTWGSGDIIKGLSIYIDEDDLEDE